MIVLHPHGPVHQEDTAGRPTLASETDLKGLKLGVVDDRYGDHFYLETLGSLLAGRCGADVRQFNKPMTTAPSPANLLKEAARCDAVIVGIGG